MKGWGDATEANAELHIQKLILESNTASIIRKFKYSKAVPRLSSDVSRNTTTIPAGLAIRS